MLLCIIGITLLITVVLSVKIFDDKIRPNMGLKRLVILATLFGFIFTILGWIQILLF